MQQTLIRPGKHFFFWPARKTELPFTFKAALFGYFFNFSVFMNSSMLLNL